MMTMLERVRSGEDGVLVMGNHPRIIQSILDFDYLAGKEAPSVLALITGNRKALKCFWGKGEILIPCYANVSSVPKARAKRQMDAERAIGTTCV